MQKVGLTFICCVWLALTSGCQRSSSDAATSLRQRGYLWQRDWTPAVLAALTEAESKMDGVVVLGAEIGWKDGQAQTVWPDIPWENLKGDHGGQLALALRIGSFPGPFSTDDRTSRAIVAVTKRLVEKARSHGVVLSEFQVDFDCGQKKLAGYAHWLKPIKLAVAPLPVVITALPAWLGEAELLPLLRQADGYVLQVHSVPTSDLTGKSSLCDPVLARRWVEQASKFGLPFSVALPTFRCVAGYDEDGKLLGVSMDSVQPAWPRGTRMLEFGADAEALAELVKEWQTKRPRGLRELMWYRVPVATDVRNWRWSTLSAVMEGRAPLRRVEPGQAGDNPIDLFLANSGEGEERIRGELVVTWAGARAIGSEALPGWIVETEDNRAIIRSEPNYELRLPPGGKRSIGWLRFDLPTPVQLELKRDK